MAGASIINMDKFEADLAESQHLRHRSRLPAYVKPTDGVADVGALTAQAVVQQYEATAVAIEAMGKEMTQGVKRCEEVLAEVRSMLADVEATAAKYREEGARRFKEVEGFALLTQEVAKVCGDMRARIKAS